MAGILVIQLHMYCSTIVCTLSTPYFERSAETLQHMYTTFIYSHMFTQSINDLVYMYDVHPLPTSALHVPGMCLYLNFVEVHWI